LFAVFFFSVVAVATNQIPPLRQDLTTSPLSSHDFTTSLLKLARLCGKSLKTISIKQFFRACKNEHAQQTIVLKKNAGQQPDSGHC